MQPNIKTLMAHNVIPFPILYIIKKATTSLNFISQELFLTPVLVNNFYWKIIRFRLEKYAVSAVTVQMLHIEQVF